MGLGSSYNYHHYMLVDIHHVHFEDDEEDNILTNFMEHLKDIAEGVDFDLTLGRNSIVTVRTDDVYYGFDTSGGFPCIFAEPIAFHDDGEDRMEEEVLADCQEEIFKVFDELVRIYTDIFRKPTTAWTSQAYKASYSGE